MEMTQERRELLLRGFEAKAYSTGDSPMFTDVRNAPKWAQDRIVEVRAALVEKKPVPPPSRDFIQGCERRSAVAATFERTQRRVPNPHALTEQQLAEARLRLEDSRLREKAEAQGRLISAQQIRQELGLI